jgi:hypothetical protein
MIKNVAVGKGGLLTKLDPRRHGHMGGGFDCINLIASLAGSNPAVTFWWCSKVDMKGDGMHVAKHLFPYDNVRFCPKVATNTGATKDGGAGDAGHIEQFSRWIEREGVTIDAGIFDVGIGSRVNIPGRVPKITEPDKKARPAIIAYAMSAPVIHVLNWMAQVNPDFKWVSVHFDPKCDMIQRDLETDPIASFAQFEYEYDTARYRNGEFVPKRYKHRYMPLEATAAFGRRIAPVSEDLKTVDFAIAMNGMNPGNNAQNRWPTVKAIVQAIDDVAIYGDWKEDFVPVADRHLLDPAKFKGILSKPELDELMKTWRFTLLSPTGKGWVTAKFYECLMAGVLPLFAPDYDTQRRLDVPKTMRLSDLRAETIRSAIDRLSPLRTAIVDHLRQVYLTPSVLDGSMLAGSLMKCLDPDHPIVGAHSAMATVTDDIFAETSKAAAGLDFLV